MDDGGTFAVNIDSDNLQYLNNLGRAPIWIIADHAGNAMPENMTLGIGDDAMQSHIAWDIGVEAVARLLCADAQFAAILGRYSRLLVDLNRDPDDPAVIPESSDGKVILGNALCITDRAERIDQYHAPYHAYITEQIAANPPKLILSLHSFTPALVTEPARQRPWHIGVLYNQCEAPSKRAIALLQEQTDLCIGDQQPYSGKHLNATMNRHAEANDIPYVGIEMRQDMVMDRTGQAKFAGILRKIMVQLMQELASGAVI